MAWIALCSCVRIKLFVGPDKIMSKFSRSGTWLLWALDGNLWKG